MFIESYLDARYERLKQKGRRDLANKFRSLISSTGGETISKEDALRLIDQAEEEADK